MKILLALCIALLASLAQAQLDVRANPATAAALPAAARGVPIDPARGFHVAEIRDGVFWATEGSHQFMFMTTGKGIVVVDAPPIFGGRLLAAIRAVSSEPITHVIYSHAHADHIGLAGQLPAGIEVIASRATAGQLRLSAKLSRAVPFGALVGGGPVPLPTRTFDRQLTLRIGNKLLRLSTLEGSAHSVGDTLVHLPEQRILMAVDAVWPGWVPFQALGEARDVAGYRRALAHLRTFDFDTLVAGHVGRLGTREDVDATIAYVDDLERKVLAALQSTDFEAIGRRVGYENSFLLVEAYFDDVARRANEEMLKTWGTQLGGADVWTYKNAAKLMMWLRLN